MIEAGDRLGAGKIFKSLVVVGGKQMHVHWTTTFGAPLPEAGDGVLEDDDLLSGEEEHPTTHTAATGLANPAISVMVKIGIPVSLQAFQ